MLIKKQNKLFAFFCFWLLFILTMNKTNTQILIVDDTPDNILALKIVINAYFKDCDIFSAGDGAEALEIANKHPLDIIILDVRMPEMDGFELCARLKKLEATKDVPVLMVSALMTDGTHRALGFDSGADGYLCKPFDNVELVANIRGLLRLKKSEDALRKQSHELEAELDKRTGNLRQSEQLWRGLFEASPDAIFIEDTQGQVLEVNPAACRLHEMTHDELVGKNVIDLVPPDERQHVAELFPRWQTGAMKTYEGVSYTKSGKVIPVDVRVTQFEYNKKPALLLHVRDISERVKIEKKLTQAQKLESVGLLAGGIAHDFNNILTGVIGNLSFAKLDMSETSKSYAAICQAEKSAFRARLLTQQLLVFAQGGSPVRKTASVKQLLEEIGGFVLSGSRCVCEVEIDANLWPAEIDVGQISQVIENILLNASQAMPSGGRIVLSASNKTIEDNDEETPEKLAPGRYVEIRIKDHGVGIAQKNLDSIFDPYFTTKKEGSGLGLATAYSIIHKHGGEITVSSIVGRGTTFFIYIPASDKKVAPQEEQPKEIIKGTGRILVMDDEPVIRTIAEVALDRIGYEVVTVENGDEAIKAYRQALQVDKPFDAVILDITIPGGMGGVETIKVLKAIDPEVKAIVSSGYATKDVMAVPERLGFRGVLTKPYNVQQLSTVLDSIIHNR